MSLDAMHDFRATKTDELYNLLTSRQVAPDKAEAIVHALVDVSESIDRVYSELIPKILSETEADKELLEERLWDVRSEFRHIDYHIQDAGLAEW